MKGVSAIPAMTWHEPQLCTRSSSIAANNALAWSSEGAAPPLPPAPEPPDPSPAPVLATTPTMLKLSGSLLQPAELWAPTNSPVAKNRNESEEERRNMVEIPLRVSVAVVVPTVFHCERNFPSRVFIEFQVSGTICRVLSYIVAEVSGVHLRWIDGHPFFGWRSAGASTIR